MLRLEQHHSRPRYVIKPMGKEKWGAEKAAKWQPGSGSQWWSSKQWAEWENRQPAAAKAGPAFPAYKQMEANKDKDGTPALTTDVNPEQTYIKMIQKGVNSVRKLEQRIRKNTEETRRAEEQWNQFEAKIKQTWLHERAQFHKDTKELKTEIAELQNLRAAALLQLQDLVHAGEPPSGSQDAGPPQMTMADNQAWQALVSQTSDTEEEDRSLEAWMAQARTMMREPTAYAGDALPGSSPTTPTMRTSSVQPMTPPGKPNARDLAKIATPGYASRPTAEGEHVMKDPYMPSPAQSVLESVLMATPPQANKQDLPCFGQVGREVSRPRTSFGKANQRMPLKVATMQPQPKISPSKQQRDAQLDRKRMEPALSVPRIVNLLDDDRDGPETVGDGNTLHHLE